MVTTLHSWVGSDWETHVKRLLRIRHGAADFVDVPDKDRGDFGVECFSRNGFAYQCYAPEEPLDISTLRDKLRAKINSDIGKFIRNRNELHQIFGKTKITRWVLVVPRHESAKILSYLTKKEGEVVRANLPYVGSDFHIQIQTEEDFPLEMQELTRSYHLQIGLDLPPLPTDELDSWAGGHSDMVKIIDGKISKLSRSSSEAERISFRNAIIQEFISAENLLDHLKRHFPEAWESAAKCRVTSERGLQFAASVHNSSNHDLLQLTIGKLKDELGERIPALDRSSIEALANGTIAEWIARCPLDFG